MKISEIIESLQETLNNYGDLEACTSIDDEGNGFRKVYYEPTPGHFDGEDFTPVENIDDEEINSVCLN